jgi:latrophilin 1
MVTDLVQNVVRVSSNLIGDKNHQSWIDLGRDEAGQAATSLMVAVEENAFLLADSVTSEKIIIKPTENIREYSIQKLSNVNYLILIHKYIGCKS